MRRYLLALAVVLMLVTASGSQVFAAPTAMDLAWSGALGIADWGWTGDLNSIPVSPAPSTKSPIISIFGGPGHIYTTGYDGPTSSFAMQVSFSGFNPSSGDGHIEFDIDGPPGTSFVNIGIGWGTPPSFGGAFVKGFMSGTGPLEGAPTSLVFEEMSGDSGSFGFIFEGGIVSTYYKNAGEDWALLNTITPGWGSAYPLLSVQVNDGSLPAVTLYDAKLAGTAPVPLPSAILLFSPALAGLVAFRRRFKK